MSGLKLPGRLPGRLRESVAMDVSRLDYHLAKIQELSANEQRAVLLLDSSNCEIVSTWICKVKVRERLGIDRTCGFRYCS